MSHFRKQRRCIQRKWHFFYIAYKDRQFLLFTNSIGIKKSDANKSSFQHICLLPAEDIRVSSWSAVDGANGGGGGEAGGGRGGRGGQPVEQEPAFPT